MELDHLREEQMVQNHQLLEVELYYVLLKVENHLKVLLLDIELETVVLVAVLVVQMIEMHQKDGQEE